MTKHLNRIDIILACLLAILPTLGYYKSPILFSSLSTLVEMLILLIIIGKILFSFFHYKINSSIALLCIFVIWMILRTLISVVTPYGRNYSFNALIVVLINAFLLVYLSESKEICCIFFRIYVFLACFFVLLYVIQFISFYVFSFSLSIKLPFELSEEYLSQYDYSGLILNNAQFSALFSEKAHFCQYVLPLQAIILSRKDFKRGYFFATLLTVIIISTASGNGIIGSLVIWFVFLIQGTFSKKKVSVRVLVLVVFAFISVITIHIVLLRISPQYVGTIESLLSPFESRDSKAAYRIFRGAAAFKEFPLIKKILGVGYRQYTGFSIKNGISTIYDKVGVLSEYFSAFFQVLLYFGIVGLTIVVYLLYKVFCKSDSCGKMLLIVYCALCISSSIFFEANCVLYFTLIFAASFKSAEGFESSEAHEMNDSKLAELY